MGSEPNGFCGVVQARMRVKVPAWSVLRDQPHRCLHLVRAAALADLYRDRRAEPSRRSVRGFDTYVHREVSEL
jgi:hypothetical protein